MSETAIIWKGGTLIVGDTGMRLHLVKPRGPALCGRTLDPRDLYQLGGRTAWEERPSDRCQSCESKLR